MAGFPGLVVADQGSEFYFHMWPGHRLCIKALRAQWGTYQTQPGPGIAVNRHEETIQQTNASSSRPFHPSLGSLPSHRRVHFFFFLPKTLNNVRKGLVTRATTDFHMKTRTRAFITAPFTAAPRWKTNPNPDHRTNEQTHRGSSMRQNGIPPRKGRGVLKPAATQRRQTLKTGCGTRGARHRRLHSVGSHLNAIPGLGKCVGPERASSVVVWDSGDDGERGTSFLSGGDEKVLERDSGGGRVTLSA